MYNIYWAPLDPSVFQFGSNWSRIGSNWVPSGLHLGPRDPTGPIWDPTGSRARFGDLASSQVRCLRTRSAFSKLVTESAESGEVVAGPAARTPIPHAPGARMTVVTLTPSNDDGFLYHVCYNAETGNLVLVALKSALTQGMKPALKPGMKPEC